MACFINLIPLELGIRHARIADVPTEKFWFLFSHSLDPK